MVLHVLSCARVVTATHLVMGEMPTKSVLSKRKEPQNAGGFFREAARRFEVLK